MRAPAPVRAGILACPAAEETGDGGDSQRQREAGDHGPGRPPAVPGANHVLHLGRADADHQQQHEPSDRVQHPTDGEERPTEGTGLRSQRQRHEHHGHKDANDQRHLEQRHQRPNRDLRGQPGQRPSSNQRLLDLPVLHKVDDEQHRQGATGAVQHAGPPVGLRVPLVREHRPGVEPVQIDQDDDEQGRVEEQEAQVEHHERVGHQEGAAEAGCAGDVGEVALPGVAGGDHRLLGRNHFQGLRGVAERDREAQRTAGRLAAHPICCSAESTRRMTVSRAKHSTTRTYMAPTRHENPNGRAAGCVLA